LAFTTTTGSGGTSLIGTSGVDTASISTPLSGNVYVAAAADNDILTLTAALGSANNYTVFMAEGNDLLNAAAIVSNSSIQLGEGADTANLGVFTASTISGLNGTDTINLSANVSSSLINGNNGNDIFTDSAVFGLSNSTIAGGQGDDTMTFNTALAVTFANSKVNGNDGNDTIAVTLGATMSQTTSTIFGGQGNDTLSVVVAAAATGGGVLSGDNGNDIATGSLGRDTIFGGEGADIIAGSTAANVDQIGDTLTGGTGVDTFGNSTVGNSTAVLIGGVNNGIIGAAVSITSAANGIDVITDFAAGAGGDRIDVNVLAALNTTPIAQGTALNAAGIKVISGTYTASSGTFVTAASDTAGPDTLIVGSGASTESYVLSGVNASTLVAGNFI
jgi:Ca2+-binding RTX toxin-like protein